MEGEKVLKEAEVDYSSMQLGLFDKCETQPGGYIVDSLFGKMSPEYCQAIQTWTFAQFLNPLQNVKLQYLDLDDGRTQDWLEADDVMLGGESSMLNISEAPKEYFSCPNEEKGCGLSQILEKNTDVPKKYFLSAKACRGILNRSERRNKTLPQLLKKALEMQAGITHDDVSIVGGEDVWTTSHGNFMTNWEKNKAHTLVATDWKDAPVIVKPQKDAYCIGNGQTNQLYLQEKCGTLNCMENPINVVQKAGNDEHTD